MHAAEHALAGRREATLLSLPSVRRMAETLAARCREPSWIRTSTASLERFRSLTGNADLEALLERARLDPSEGDRALHAFGHALDRKSTRLNSSHITISYAVFCLKKKK